MVPRSIMILGARCTHKILFPGCASTEMTLRYEANPPRIEHAGDMDKFMHRLAQMASVCDGVHITENVLGIPRVHPVAVGQRLHESLPDLTMTLSMRVRDKNSRQIDTFVADAADAGFTGMLVVAGDRSSGSVDTGESPSMVVSRLQRNRIDEQMDMYLSVPTNPNRHTMGAKIRAGPKGFMTQVIHTVSQINNIVTLLPGFHIIPILLFPSPRNHKAAKFLHIDMSCYGDFLDFVGRVHDITGDVLITSPGDYEGLYRFLARM